MVPIVQRGGWLIFLSLLTAFVLTILPLPVWAQPLRPLWVAMVLLYWNMALPGRVGVGIAWLVGLMLDVSTGTLLGQQAGALALVAFIMTRTYSRIRMFPPWQQALSVLVLLLLYQMLVLWTKGMAGQSIETLRYWGASITSTLLWPWLFLVMRELRRRFRIS